MTHITPWSVRFLYVHLYFLTSKTASILILDRASLSYASVYRPTGDRWGKDYERINGENYERIKGAMDQAYYQYTSSDTHNAVKEQFSLRPTQYSILQFTEFVLSHRLW